MAKEFDFSSCETFNTLPLDHKRFILEYLKTYNASKAYLKFHKKSTVKAAIANASRLITSDNIQKALREVSGVMLQGDVASAQELREYWTTIQRQDISKVVGWTEQGLVFTASSEEMPVEAKKLIKKIKVTEKTSAAGDWTECKTEVELHDPLKASELLGRTHGIFVDKTELTGKDGSPLMPAVGTVIFNIGKKKDASD